MATMNTTQKNLFIKETAVSLVSIPENAIQIADFSYAIPVEVEGEPRFAVIAFSAKNNKDTKTTKAFDPYAVRAKWIKDAEEKAAQKAENERNKKEKAKLKKKIDIEEEEA